MVTVAFAVATAGAASTAAVAGAYGTLALIAAGGMLASYADQAFLYPELFGKKNPRPTALEGFQLSTTDPGAPRWEIYGSRAWVPCHYLWSLNIRDETVSGGGNQVGKGGRPFVQQVRADVGLATCDGPIVEIDSLFANERPFWSRQFNRVVLEDHRWSITAGTGGEAGNLVLQATDADVVDFSGLFNAGALDGDVARLENVAPSSLAGFYRVVGVSAHTGGQRSRIVLKPLRGQTPGTGTAGSIFEPSRLRRIDQGVASHQWIMSASGGGVFLRRPDPQDPSSFPPTYTPHTIPGPPFQNVDELQRIWVVGAVYRLDGFTPSTMNGRFRLVSWNLTKAPNGGNPVWGGWLFAPLDQQPIPGTGSMGTGTVSLPGVIYRDEGGGFLFIDPQQGWAEYTGSADQAQDPTLATHEPDPPAHRGIAHISLRDWNLGPHSNTFPNVVALARSRNGETVASAIDRICRRSLPEGHVDVSQLRTKGLLGHSVPGGMASGQALQPIATMYGIAVQDRGGVLTFLDERDLPIVPVATRHLNARPLGEQSNVRGFVTNRSDKADIPERVVLQYIDPAGGENEAEGSGDRSPGSSTRGKRDTLPINLRPLVAWPYEVKRRSRELLRRIQLESHRGQVRLPPGYMDVLPGTCLTFVANNHDDEYAPASPTIALDTRLRDLLPRSVAVQVRFANGQVATLVDNGLGKLEGFPAGITAPVNTVNYATGRIELLTTVALDTDHPPLIAYRYEKQWLVRANKATLHGSDFCVSCDVVKTTTDNPLPPVPRDLSIGLGGALASEVPLYRTRVLDIPALYPGQTRSVLIGITAAPEPGAQWRGAIVYESPNGVDRWTPVGQIQSPTVMGTVPVSNLPGSLDNVNLGIVDWHTELVIDLPGGELLEDATLEMIGAGQNWLLIGAEILAFHEADSAGGTAWTLRGLVRALRHTIVAVDGHADGEQVVLLTGLGIHGLVHEPVGGLTAANRTYHFRVVPGGGAITDVETLSPAILGRSALPAPPVVEPFMLTQKVGSYLELTWLRRSQDQTTLFGPSPLQAGETERYEVIAFDIATAATLIGSIGVDAAIQATKTQTWTVGDEAMGTPLVDRVIRYEEVDIAAHGYVFDVTPLGFVVYQVGQVGRSERSQVVFMTPAT